MLIQEIAVNLTNWLSVISANLNVHQFRNLRDMEMINMRIHCFAATYVNTLARPKLRLEIIKQVFTPFLFVTFVRKKRRVNISSINMLLMNILESGMYCL
jgi:hypothetical protein